MSKKINIIQALNYSAILEKLKFSPKSLFEKLPQLERFIYSEESLLSFIKEVSQILQCSEKELSALYDKIIRVYQEIKFQYSIITLKDHRYPTIIKDQTFRPLPIYFARGDLSYLSLKGISIVGTRNPSEEGVLRAKKLSMLASHMGFVIVSGLAKGIDTAAHWGAIKSGGKTIAVVGTPLNQHYPKENEELQEAIAESQLLLSQFPFNHPITPLNFPARNNTMAGLTLATIIVEAGETSGALIQARQALAQGRKLFLLESVSKNKTLKWPQKYIEKGAIVISRIEELVKELEEFSPQLKGQIKKQDLDLFEIAGD